MAHFVSNKELSLLVIGPVDSSANYLYILRIELNGIGGLIVI